MTRFVHVIYCDDIRQEIGGKRSFMGIYGSTLVLNQAEGVLPKLCMAVEVVTPVDRPFKKLRLVIARGDDIFAEHELSADILAQQEIAKSRRDGSAVELVAFNFDLVFAPFAVNGPAKIRVRVVTEDGEMRGRGLEIATASEPAVAPTNELPPRRRPTRTRARKTAS